MLNTVANSWYRIRELNWKGLGLQIEFARRGAIGTTFTRSDLPFTAFENSLANVTAIVG